MKNFYRSVYSFKLSQKSKIRNAINSFSKKELLFFYFLVIILFISTIVLLEYVNKSFMVSIPIKGGSITEGIIGTPRFINPVLAISDADQDMVSLIYSGLMRKDSNGKIVPDLASTYNISKNDLTYTFTLKDNLYFQDGKPITADDVVFTINKVKDKTIKSPREGNWNGVNVEKIDNKTIQFILQQPYASFLENTTLGIMPEHIWDGLPIELNNANTNPIGSGPYQIKDVGREPSGIIDYYDLTSFKQFNLGQPYINNITLRFYPNEENLIKALETHKVNQISSISPENAQILKEEGYKVESSILPRIFGLFFNQSQNQIFTDKNIIAAINYAIDKNEIVRTVLDGYGSSINGPIPKGMDGYQESDNTNNTIYEDNVQKAKDILSKDGWIPGTDGFLQKSTTDSKKNKITKELEFSISTGNAPDLTKSAEMIKQYLEKIGIKVDIKTFEIGSLNQSVIRPRKYDALLFGEIINHESDLFAFWYSSQRKDPGLNVAMYTNAKVDKILENAFITTDPIEKAQEYTQFANEIKQDMPAVFLYSPSFIYVVSKNLENLNINNIISPSDRFSNVYLWYTEKDNIWQIFSH